MADEPNKEDPADADTDIPLNETQNKDNTDRDQEKDFTAEDVKEMEFAQLKKIAEEYDISTAPPRGRRRARRISVAELRKRILADLFDADDSSLGRKVWLGLGLLVLTAVVLGVWFQQFHETQGVQRDEHTVPWIPADGVTLRPGPVSFVFDQADRLLRYRGAIDASVKAELVALIAKDGVDLTPPNEAGTTYWAAIDQLAFDSSDTTDKFLFRLILLGGLSAMLGVQLRSLSNFVGRAAYRGTLHIGRWWSWYALRPAEGFILGIVLIWFIQAGLLDAGESPNGSILWWLALALLAGFGASDFSEKLRMIGKTIFGGEASGTNDANAPS